MIAWATSTAGGGLGIVAVADSPIAAAVIGGVFVIANTVVSWALKRKDRDR